MPRPEIPDAVRRLIRQHLRSVSELEVLLLLRVTPGKPWSVGEVARAQVARDDAARGFLEHLCDGRLLEHDGAADSYRYAPERRTATTVDALAGCYASSPRAVVSLIFAGPDDPASTLADAFRVRRRPH